LRPVSTLFLLSLLFFAPALFLFSLSGLSLLQFSMTLFLFSLSGLILLAFLCR